MSCGFLFWMNIPEDVQPFFLSITNLRGGFVGIEIATDEGRLASSDFVDPLMQVYKLSGVFMRRYSQMHREKWHSANGRIYNCTECHPSDKWIETIGKLFKIGCSNWETTEYRNALLKSNRLVAVSS